MSKKTIVNIEVIPTITSFKRKVKDQKMSSLEDYGLELVQGTPSPKKQNKKSKVQSLDMKNTERQISVYRVPYTIHTMGRSDGANVLSVIPGGYTYHYHDWRYIKILHKHLSDELGSWIDNVMQFVQDIYRDVPGLFDNDRSHYITSYVMQKVVPLKKLVDKKDSEIVLHALNLTALQAFFQCDNTEAKLIYYLCSAREFQLKFIPEMDKDVNTYEIYTVFSHGQSWNFVE